MTARHTAQEGNLTHVIMNPSGSLGKLGLEHLAGL